MTTYLRRWDWDDAVSIDGISIDWRGRYPNFSPDEVCSKDDGSIIIKEDAMDALQQARTNCGFAFRITSGYRTQAHNDSIPGSVKNSRHVAGDGFDISVAGMSPEMRIKLVAELKNAGFKGFGYYSDSMFLHADTHREREWGNPKKFFGNPSESEPVEKTNKKNDQIIGGISTTSLVGLGQAAITSSLPVWFVVPVITIILAGLAYYIYRRTK